MDKIINMNKLSIYIMREGEEGPDPEANKENLMGELSFAAATIIEKGTRQGGTSVLFRLQDYSSGGYYVAQLTPNLLEGLFAAWWSANQEFMKKQGKQQNSY